MADSSYLYIRYLYLSGMVQLLVERDRRIRLVVAHGIGKLEHAPDHLRREEARELGREDAGERVEVGALVILEASRRDHFS